MVSKRDYSILLTVIKHCKRVEKVVLGVDKETFLKDDDLTDVVSFNILQIGESAKHLSEEIVKEYNGVPWKSIKGMRDRVAHGYDTIRIDDVWKTATKDITPLREYCERILKESNSN